MNEKQYVEKQNKLKARYLKHMKALYTKYIWSQRKYEIGDIIMNISGLRIKVQSFSHSSGGVLETSPKIVYVGLVVKADLTLRKDGLTGTIYGNDGVKLLKKNS